MMSSLLLLGVVFLCSALLSLAYLRYGIGHGPYAEPNFRSLHKRAVPKGGGLAIAVSVLVGCLYLNAKGTVGFREFLFYVPGAGIVAFVGALDDRLDIPARYRLPFQMLTAVCVCFGLGGMPNMAIGPVTLSFGVVGTIGLAIACVWFYNLFNFIDGIDGMASSAGIFIGCTMASVLWLEGDRELAIVLGFLAAANAGFLMFNWPPSKMFMGDTGSSFTSFILSAVFVQSLWKDSTLLWIWMLVCGYYVCDTTVTTTLRALTIRHWYLPHRSHAYQNLARISGSHGRVVALVLAFDVIWLLPLLFVVLSHRDYAPIITCIAYIPLIAFTLKFGPLFENK